MKKLLIVAVCLLFSPALLANNGATTVPWNESGSYYVDCLGVDVEFDFAGRDIFKTFIDENGNWHWVRNSRWVGQLQAVGSDMSWTAKGGGPSVWKYNANNPQVNGTDVRHYIALADGDYPNLFWTYVFSGTRNANGVIVTARSILDIRCLSH